MRILVDISETAASGLKTGIQRVVREMAVRAAKMSQTLGVEIIPVIAMGEHFYPVLDVHDVFKSQPWLLSIDGDGAPRKIKRCALGFAKNLLELFPPMANLARRLLYWRATKENLKLRGVSDKPQRIGGDDVLLMLDSFKSGLSWDAAVKARENGATVVTMVYDLTPISHPQYYDIGNANAFADYIEKVLALSDHVLTISDFCVGEIRKFCASNEKISRLSNRVDYIHLGYDFHLAESNETVLDGRLPTGFFGNADVFIMIGTIEPRKNHAFVLAAFEKHWEHGGHEKLLWVGRNGWKVDKLIRRARTSKYYGNRFFMIHDANDVELAAMIERSSACIQASEIEGFGLPLVEAMQARLPVLASDIPVLREIGGDFPLYFSLQSPDCLIDAVVRFRQTKPEMVKKLSGFRWHSWDDASKKLYRKVTAVHKT